MHTNEEKKLEDYKSWRFVKVLYWLVIVLLLLKLSISEYESFSAGLLLLALCYPGFIMIRRSYVYIQGIQLKSGKPSIVRKPRLTKNHKSFLKDCLIVLLLLIFSLVFMGIILGLQE